MQYNTYAYPENTEVNEKMLNSFDTDLYHLVCGGGGKQSTTKRTWWGRGESDKNSFKKKKNNPETLYLILIEAVRHAVNFKTRYSRNTSFKLHAIDLEALSVSQI